MTLYPIYLTDYPNMNTAFPYSLKIEVVESVVPHRHDFLEFILVLEGHGVEIINGVKHQMKPGTLIFLLPYQFHQIQCEAGASLHLYICNFDLELLIHSKEEDWGIANIVLEDSAVLPPFVQLDAQELNRLRGIFDDMMQEYDGDKRMRSIMIKAKLLEALVHFDRLRYRQHSDGQLASSGQGFNSGQANFWQVIHYVHLHYREDISLEHLAKKFHYNVSHLSELFKIRIGQNYVHFVQGLRIRHACGLLSSTKLSISSIAYEVGFGSFQTFSRTFLKIKGMTPTVYRKHSP